MTLFRNSSIEVANPEPGKWAGVAVTISPSVLTFRRFEPVKHSNAFDLPNWVSHPVGQRLHRVTALYSHGLNPPRDNLRCLCGTDPPQRMNIGVNTLLCPAA